jgi:hypothetical protein
MSPEALAARVVLWVYQRLRACVDRLAPPELLLADRITGVTGTVVTGALVASGLVERLDDVPRPARELAAGGILDGDTVERILRGGAALGLLTRSSAGFRRNRLTRCLQPGGSPSLGPLAIYFASELNLRTWSRFLEALRNGVVPFHHVHGCGVWEHLAVSEEDRVCFARAMDALTRLDAEAVVRTPGFSGVAGLCDVAGGTGVVLEAALRAHPALQGVLVDAPSVVELAQRRFEDSGLLGRVRLEPADVFVRVPEGLPAYVLKDVLHDWDDARALVLLQVVRRAMPTGARVLLVELLLEKGPVAPLASVVDLQMLAITGGRQRSVEELAALLGKAGFGPPAVHRTRTASSVLMAEAV